MRIQQAVLALMLCGSFVAFSAQPAWSQISDPFGAAPSQADSFEGDTSSDPFAGPRTKPTRTPQVKTVRHGGAGNGGTGNKVPGHGQEEVRVVSVGESESEQKIHVSLQDETSNTFIDAPLIEAIESISKTHDIPMLIDARALEEIGLTADTPVSLELHNVSLRSFLRLMLRDLDLTYMIKDDVLQITTLEAAESCLETRMYRLPQLLSNNTEQVVDAIQAAVLPDSWDAAGGPSIATSIDRVLIVSTTSDVHQGVKDFLNTLIHMQEMQ